MRNLMISSALMFVALILPGLSSSALAAYVMDRYVVSAAGNTHASSASYRQFVCIGEPAIAEASITSYGIKSGFIAQEATPGYTATITLTPGPTATPSPYRSPTASPTPLLTFDDFQGAILDSKYVYVAPNPAKGGQVHFRVLLKQAAEVEIRIYTPRGQPVLTKSAAYYPQGWNTVLWNASGMANGVYFFVVEAKANGETEKVGVKKLALIK